MQASGIFLCERVLQDMISREAVTCVNIFNGLSATQLPVIVPVVYAFAQITSADSPFEYEYVILESNSKVIASSGKARVEPHAGSDLATSHKVISAFNGLTFANEGIYKVVLYLDDHEAASLPLKVVLAAQEVLSK